MCRMVFVLMIVGLCVHTAAALPGSGTQQDPFRIESLADFDEFAADPNYWAGFTRLETDVNLAGRTYSTAVIAPDTDSSTSWFEGTAFTGIFDGNDHKIMGLTIDDVGAGNYYLGLFGYIGGYGEVRNLGLEGGSISGDYWVGGLVGLNSGSVSNCYSTGDVSGDWSVGGLVGSNNHTITNCYSTGVVNGQDCVGGLVGANGGSISDCYSTGDVNGVEYVGGLVGANGDYESEGGGISNCYSTSSVSGYDYVGGLVGNNNYGSVSNCYSTGDVSGGGPVGGLVGDNSLGSVSDSYSIGDVNGEYSIGGLVGYNVEGSISNCYSTSSVSGGGRVGGLVGGNGGSVSDCYSTGDVNGYGEVGGLVGANGVSCREGGTIWNCYSTGDVNGVWNVGGLVGLNGLSPDEWCRFSRGYIFNSYSIGDINGIDDVGGLVGYHLFGNIERSFWDVETSGEPNMCGYQGEVFATGCDPNCGKTTAQMQTRLIFTEAGWDFVDIWGIGENQTYPYLRIEPAGDFNYDKKVDLFDLAILAAHWLENTP